MLINNALEGTRFLLTMIYISLQSPTAVIFKRRNKMVQNQRFQYLNYHITLINKDLKSLNFFVNPMFI